MSYIYDEPGDLYGTRPTHTTRVANRRAVVELQLRRLQEELARLEQFPASDPYPDLTILHVRRTLLHKDGETQTYDYAVIRADGRWYATGDVNRFSRAGWSKLVDWIISGHGEILAAHQPPSDPSQVDGDSSEPMALGRDLPRDAEQLHERLGDLRAGQLDDDDAGSV